MLPLLAYYNINKNEEKNNYYIKKLENCEKEGNGVLVHEAEFIKEFLRGLTAEVNPNNSSVKEVLKQTSESLFDITYKEVMDNLKISI